MDTFLHHLAIALPMFSLVFIGYALMRFSGWPVVMSDSLTRFVFTVALPAMLFHLMSDFSTLAPVDARLLIAFFGACLIVFVIDQGLVDDRHHLLRTSLGRRQKARAETGDRENGFCHFIHG